MSAIELNQESFDKMISESDVPVLVDFWADWCNPCKMLLPIIEELSTEVGTTAKICKVNIDDQPELASRFGIMTIPTMIVFKNGEESQKLVGVRQKNELLEVLK